MRLPSGSGPLGAQTSNDVRHRRDLAGCHVLIAQCEDFQHGQGFLGFLEGGHILQDRLGLTVLGDDQGLTLFRQVGQDLSGARLEVADRFDLR